MKWTAIKRATLKLDAAVSKFDAYAATLAKDDMERLIAFHFLTQHATPFMERWQAIADMAASAARLSLQARYTGGECLASKSEHAR